MQGTIQNIFTVFKSYNGGTWFLPLFLLALLYLFLKSGKEMRRNLLIVAAAAVVLVFNDLAFKAASKVVGSETYYRFLWMVPVVLILGYVFVDIFVRQKSKICRVLVLFLGVGLLFLGGTPCINADSFKRPDQVRYLNTDVIEICDMIEKDKEREHPRVAVPYELVLSMRLYDSNIVNYINRETYLSGEEIKVVNGATRRQKRAYKLVNGKKVKAKRVKKMFEKGNIVYMVIQTEYDMDKLMLKAGCSVLGRTGRYTIYRY